MRLKEKILYFIILTLLLSFSYYMCSTHEYPSQGYLYLSRRKRFCARPLYITILLIFLFIFIFL